MQKPGIRFSLPLCMLAIWGLYFLGASGMEPALAASLSDYAGQVVVLVNQQRHAAGLPALTRDDRLMRMAQIRAEELTRNFSHTRPDGRGPFTILDDNNYRYTAAAENIASGQATPEKTMNSWMNSSGHRANILSKSVSRIGVGVARHDGKLFWVQLFAR